MSYSVYQTLAVIGQVLAGIVQGVPVGTNLNVVSILFALMSGRFLWARGAVFPALADLGLSDSDVRRAVPASCVRRRPAGALRPDGLLPALVFALVGAVGSVGKIRLALPRRFHA